MATNSSVITPDGILSPHGQVVFNTAFGPTSMRKMTGDELRKFLNEVKVVGLYFGSDDSFRGKNTKGNVSYGDDYYCLNYSKEKNECFDIYVDVDGRYFVTKRGDPPGLNSRNNVVNQIKR